MSPVAVTFGTLAGLFGALMLFYGIAGVVWVMRDWRRVDSEDVFEVAMFNIIGLVCACFAVRWVWSAIRSPRREGGR